MAEILHPETRIGHIHLKVSDIQRALDFYEGILGFTVTSRMGDQAAFVSAGGYHHHIGLNTWESKGSTPPPAGHTGLFHFAILLPTRKSLADVVRRLQHANYPIDGSADHGVSEAIYITGPDGNGIELYWDRPKEEWVHDDSGNIEMKTSYLDIEELLRVE